MKTFEEFKNPTLNAMASGGQQERGDVTNTSSDNLQAQALKKRREGASSKAQQIAKRQIKQKQINQQKREGGINR